MKMYTIPILNEPSQTLTVRLGNQTVDIALTMRLGNLYADVRVNGKNVVSGRVCLNHEPIIKESFRPFIGELYFEDLQGNENPVYGGLGRRFVLRWIEP
ncbi:hypothetical protein LVJ85_05520 [Neisseria sp. Dent CA1/247]|uniref:phage baseplate plug family protein n=1 Tax=Neisseria sp. Dent CA1/247 TaxID=2912675 RepID=UPI001FD43479|nr:hypothetical protein [Neisseria sp. Dent CA1/247]UOO77920.1 hypothetical protein LVJ85_05520 [Neisseria sp. Dent CA1/247]